MLSSLAATRPTHPSTTLFRYTKGVLPINCGSKSQINTIYAVYNFRRKTIPRKQPDTTGGQLTSVTSLAIPVFSAAILSG